MNIPTEYIAKTEDFADQVKKQYIFIRFHQLAGAVKGEYLFSIRSGSKRIVKCVAQMKSLRENVKAKTNSRDLVSFMPTTSVRVERTR